MPIDRRMMSRLKTEYGGEKGERVYYAMENEGKIRPKRRGLHASRHDANSIETVGHARRALRHSAKHSSPEEHAALVQKVKAMHPNLHADRTYR